MADKSKVRFEITVEQDIILARKAGRGLSTESGLSEVAAAEIALAISELARNILIHAGTGKIMLQARAEGSRVGIEVIASDEGPGIANIELALRDGFSTAQGLGLGLPGTRRLVDEFEIKSEPGRGTTVKLTKWQFGR